MIKRKVRSKISGVVKEEIQDIETVKVGIDKATTQSIYANDKENFSFTDIIFAPYGTDVIEDDIISHGGIDYDVVSVIDPMRRHHHLEILCNKVV